MHWAPRALSVPTLGKGSLALVHTKLTTKCPSIPRACHTLHASRKGAKRQKKGLRRRKPFRQRAPKLSPVSPPNSCLCIAGCGRTSDSRLELHGLCPLSAPPPPHRSERHPPRATLALPTAVPIADPRHARPQQNSTAAMDVAGLRDRIQATLDANAAIRQQAELDLKNVRAACARTRCATDRRLGGRKARLHRRPAQPPGAGTGQRCPTIE